MKLLIFSILFFAVHFTWAGNRILDLFKKSKRKHKTQWMVFILSVPLVGPIVYDLTMKRKRYLR